MCDEGPVFIYRSVRLWIEGVEDLKITKERLIESLFRAVKAEALNEDAETRYYEDILEDVESGEIKDEDIRELVEIVLNERKLGHKKAQIKKSIENHFDKKYGFTEGWTGGYFGHKWINRNWSHQIYYLFDITYDLWMPPYPRGRRRPREYPIERLRELRAQGLSYREIEKETGVSKSTAHRILTTER